MDRRIQKTRDSIFAAFERLLAQKSYDKITIRDLIDEANVGRSTFYAHFETKDDLLKAMCGDLFDHIFAADLEAEKSHDFSLSQKNAQIMLTHILYHLNDDAPRLHRLFACESSALFWQYFRRPFRELVIKYVLPAMAPSFSPLPKELLIDHITASFIEIVKWWFETGLKESPETMERYFEIMAFRK
jgi:AcrR family transcriptional regulator